MMPEFYQRATAQQFILTDEQKAAVLKGERVDFEGCTVKHGGNGKFHALFSMGELLKPIYEGQWLVREPAPQVYSDLEFRAKFITPPNQSK
jgi:hypothetical protein